MALCIVHSGVLEPCCAVSTLMCGSHSSGQFTTLLSISEQQLHVSHWFEQLQGQPGEVPWQLGPFSTLSLCQGWVLPSPPGCWSSAPHCRESTLSLHVLFITAEEAPEQLWRWGGLSRESFVLIYALLLR